MTRTVPTAMREDWDARARRDPFYYIRSDRQAWDPEAFFASGEEDTRILVDPRLREVGFDPRKTSLLEVGCGVGRMTRALARRFERVLAADVSPEMLRRARELGTPPGVEWLQVDGTGFPTLGNGSLDAVFSYQVLQHVPTRDAALRLVAECVRVVRPGGVFLLQFNSHQGPLMNRRGRAMAALLDALHESQARGVLRVFRAVLPHDQALGRTWRGAVLEPEAVAGLVRGPGARVEVLGAGTRYTWCYGIKA